MFEAELIVDVEGLFGGQDDPADGDVSVRRDGAGSRLMLAGGGASVHAELIGEVTPIEDDLVGGVGETQIGGIRLGFDDNLDRGAEGRFRADAFFALDDDRQSISLPPRMEERVGSGCPDGPKDSVAWDVQHECLPPRVCIRTSVRSPRPHDEHVRII